MENVLKPNEGKDPIIQVDGQKFERLPIRTHLITKNDDIIEVAEKYGPPVLSQPGDILFISGKIVACSQGRAIPLEEIPPRKLAISLSDHVTKTPYGIGLGMPETMEMALQEVGTLRILFAAVVSVIGKKIFKKNGWFYNVAGYRARCIDAPRHNTIPPYNCYVVLVPLEPDKICRRIKERLGYEVCIVDDNDTHVNILGVSSDKIDRKQFARILKDNPLGQDARQTPMGIIRKVK